MRYQRILEVARQFPSRRTLDLGCGLGQLTRELSSLEGQLFGSDLSPVALRRARVDLHASSRRVELFAARSIALPVADASFDLIVAADGLYSWDIDRDARAIALGEIHRALAPRGRVVFTEHMRPARFAAFVDEIKAGPLHIERTTYFHDRPAYQFESWLKGVRTLALSRALVRSVRVARALSGVGRLFGTRGARHICVIARRD